MHNPQVPWVQRIVSVPSDQVRFPVDNHYFYFQQELFLQALSFTNERRKFSPDHFGGCCYSSSVHTRYFPVYPSPYLCAAISVLAQSLLKNWLIIHLLLIIQVKFGCQKRMSTSQIVQFISACFCFYIWCHRSKYFLFYSHFRLHALPTWRRCLTNWLKLVMLQNWKVVL